MIGIFDSGAGGLSVYREIRKILPEQDCIYYSDNANCPYGPKPKEFIIRRAKEITEFLLSEGADIIVVACNTATAIAIKNLREDTIIYKTIAKNMHESLSTMAQLTLNTSFDATKILALREQLKANAEKFGLSNITLNDMILFAVSRVILNHRSLNANYLDDTMRFFNTVNLGIAVDTDRGLLVPTLMHAEKLTLNELSAQAKALIGEAQKGTIAPDKLKNGSFTVTNLGSLGIESFTPVINPPQTGILGVDTITRRIKEVNGEDVTYPAMGLSLTFDHRALDGAPAAKFLKELVFALENFDMLLIK